MVSGGSVAFCGTVVPLCLRGWVLDPPQMPNSVDAQVPEMKRCGVCI